MSSIEAIREIFKTYRVSYTQIIQSTEGLIFTFLGGYFRLTGFLMLDFSRDILDMWGVLYINFSKYVINIQGVRDLLQC